VGIDDDNHNFWNNDKFEFIIGNYPCAIPTKENDLGVSVLCLTWNCYLYEDDTLTKQCEALQRDFEHCLLYIAEDKVEFISKYFKNVKEIGCNLYYFSNI
jgi:hypothetical protein